MYAQQAVDEINDNLFILPNTHLTLEMDARVYNNDKTVEAANAIEARAKAAGRPLVAMLGGSSSHMAAMYDAKLPITQKSTGVPIVGFYTGAGKLSDTANFPNFVRMYPPVSVSQHILKKLALEFGWNRIGLICDKPDSYSLSAFDLFNGTDTSNPTNLQPPATESGQYDTPHLEIVYAASIDLTKEDANSTLDALVAAIKAKDVKVFIVFGMSAFIERVVLYGLDRGIFGAGFQIILDAPPDPEAMDPKTRAALDGSVLISPASTSPTYPGMQRSITFWKRHPPTQFIAGGDTTTPFLVSGRKTRFQDAALYDSITFAAVAIDACLKKGCRPAGHGYEEVMPYFRAAFIDGVAGPASIMTGSNDPAGRMFTVSVGKNPANRGLGVGGPYMFEDVTVMSAMTPDVQVCVEPRIGDRCSDRSASPRSVKCFASSATSISVEWEAALSQGDGLLTGYRVSAFAFDEQVTMDVNSTANTRVTFALDTANAHQRVKQDMVYTVQVEAMYDKATIFSKVSLLHSRSALLLISMRKFGCVALEPDISPVNVPL